MEKSFADFGIHGINPVKGGQQYTTCPKCSSKRQASHQKIPCLGVNVEGKYWHCNHCGWSGSLYVKSDRPKFEPKPIESKAKTPKQIIFDHFATRGITSAVVSRNKITMDIRYFGEKKKAAICFNYFLGDMLVNIKFRTKDKEFQQVKGGSKIFYKLNDIDGHSECIITEGEFDALSFEVAGYKNAISVPDGAPPANAINLQAKLEYLDNCSEYFTDKKKIFLATDTDAPGLRLREELARRLGKNRCWVVNYPEGCKDANDVLMKHGKDALKKCLHNAELYPIEGVHYAHEAREQYDSLWENGFPAGANTQYSKFDELMTFYGSQLTVVTGVPSHGKSNFLDQIALKLMFNSCWKFGVFSPENSSIEIHMTRLAEIITGKPFLPSYNGQMSKDEKDFARCIIDENFFFILPDNENYTIVNILNSAAGLVLKHGIKGLIIDPWNTIEHQYGKESETIYTGRILNQLKYFARKYDIHLFLVAHPRKITKKGTKGMSYEIPTLYDISGSANWYNIADNGIVVYRDFSNDFTSKDTLVFVQKVKHKFIGKTGFTKFNFDTSCQRYYEISDAQIGEEEDAKPHFQSAAEERDVF